MQHVETISRVILLILAREIIGTRWVLEHRKVRQVGERRRNGREPLLNVSDLVIVDAQRGERIDAR